MFHLLIPYIRPYIYVVWPYVYKNETETPMTQVQWLIFAMIVAHFAKRELETIFLHKFAANTMPASLIIRNSAFYWLVAGLVGAIDIYAPQSLSARPEIELLDYVGIVLYLYGEVCNYIVHAHLASLRSRGGTEKGIPTCIGSSLVTCPNYMFEIIAWFGIILICRSWAIIIFLTVGCMYMRAWSRGKEKALRQIFGDKYKKKKYTMFPGLA
jgi:very-long-chain enoyl-CoA reductase